MSSYYINDFNLFGRSWRVSLQAEEADRASVEDIFRVHVRNAQGQMVPIRAIADIRVEFGPQSIVRYNNVRSLTVNGEPAAGRSSGDALAAMLAPKAGYSSAARRAGDRAGHQARLGASPELPGARTRLRQ
jgi:multidrug efflux pump subunit AcrB